MDERIDILNSNGDFTGQTAMKSEAHENGWFHPTVHIWFYTSNGKILLQKRGKNKDIHPLLWDVSVAGHVGAGEDILLSVMREVEEEIKLKISEKDLTKIGIFKSEQKHHKDLVDFEFHHTFLCKLVVPLEQLKKQESEVEDLKLININQFSEELHDAKQFNKYVPHNLSYYHKIIQQIKSILKNESFIN